MRRLRRGRSREDEGEFLVDSPNVLQEALETGAEISTILVTNGFLDSDSELVISARGLGVTVACVDEAEMSEIASTKTPQGVAAAVAIRNATVAEVAKSSVLAVLDSVQDPGNVGAILRSADCFGAGVLLGRGCADLYNPKVVRSSAGAIFHTVAARELDLPPILEQLKSDGFTLVGADADSETSFAEFDYPSKCALVLGNEAAGLSESVRGALDQSVAVPMRRRSQSLNVAIAGSMILHAACAAAPSSLDLAAVVSSVNHDLRSPLTSVKGFASTIEKRWDSLDDDLKREMVGQISAASDRLLRAVSDLVDTARLERGEVRCVPIAFDPRPVIADAAEQVGAEYRDVEMEISMEQLQFELYADRDRFIQAMRVLLENAAKHGNGQVKVSVSSGHGWIEIDVADNGGGLTAEEVELVMNGRLELRSRGSQPSGIGLALHVVAGVAELQGGELSALERSGRGSTFCLRLPAAHAEAGIGTEREVEYDG